MNFWLRLNTRSIINIRAIFQKKSEKGWKSQRKAYQLDEEMGKIVMISKKRRPLWIHWSRKLNDGVGNSDDTDEEYR